MMFCNCFYTGEGAAIVAALGGILGERSYTNFAFKRNKCNVTN
jgi:hypothetical protein